MKSLNFSRLKRQSLAIFIAMVCAFFTIAPDAANAFVDGPVNCGGGGTFTIRNTTVESSSEDCSGVVTIPDGITYLNVDSFYGTAITSITIPSSVTGIGAFSFQDCVHLTSVSLSEGLIGIGQAAFAYTAITSIDIPNSVVDIGSAIFQQAESLVSVTLPSGLTMIPSYAFSGALALTSITIPDGVTVIDNFAFDQAISLSSVTIPNSVTNINEGAFRNSSGTTALTSITLPESLTYIGQYAFQGQNALTSITIPSSINAIDYLAFDGDSSLASVTFTGLQAPWVASDAFSNIANSPIVHIQARATGFGFDAGTWIGLTVQRAHEDQLMTDGTFDCNTGARQTVRTDPNIVVEGGTVTSGLQCFGEVVVPQGVVRIGGWAFGDTNETFPTSITLPSTLRSIGYDAFAYNPNLIAVTIPNGVTSIESEAFMSSGNLVSVTVPASVTSLGESVFRQDYSLTSVIFEGGITSIPARTFDQDESLVAVTIPNTVTSIGTRAFRLTNLNSVTIPNSVTQIGYQAFARTSLTSVVIPNSVTSIEAAVFQGSRSLASVTLPNGITSIPDDMFLSTGLTSFVIPASVTSIGSYAFCDTPLISITIPNSVTTIGEGAFVATTSLTSISIPEGVTTIAPSLFADAGLTSITIPSSVTSIGDDAFFGTPLRSVTIPAGVTSIGVQAFYNASLLRALYFMGNVAPSIDYQTFEGVDTSLAKVLVQSNSTDFGSVWHGFDVVSATADGTYDCSTGLASNSGTLYTISNRVVSQGSACSGAVVLPPGVTTIGASAFAGASSIVSFELPATVTSIGQRSFAGTTSLEHITIPSSVTSIGESAFAGAGTLATVTFLGNAPASVGVNAFSAVAVAAQANIDSAATGFGEAGSLWNGLTVTPSFTQNRNDNETVVPPVSVPAFNVNPLVMASNAQTFTLKGDNLDSITAVKVAGKASKIIRTASGDLILNAPDLPEGYYNVEITSAQGIITMQDILHVVKPYALKRTLDIKLSSGSSALKLAISSLKKLYLKGTTANLLTCVVTVASNASASEITKATAQAKATCKSVLIYADYIRSVSVQISKTGIRGSAPVLEVTFDRTLTGK